MKKFITISTILILSSIALSDTIGSRSCWFYPDAPIYIIIPSSNVVPTANNGRFPPEDYNTEVAGIYYPAGMVHGEPYYKQIPGDLYIWPDVWLGIWYASHIEFISVPGDLNNDGEVNGLDLTLIQNSLGSVPGNCNWVAQADHNNNSVIDYLDYLYIKSQFGNTIYQKINYINSGYNLSPLGEEQWTDLYIYNPILIYEVLPTGEIPDPILCYKNDTSPTPEPYSFVIFFLGLAIMVDFFPKIAEKL
jgi:hypothetical protein